MKCFAASGRGGSEHSASEASLPAFGIAAPLGPHGLVFTYLLAVLAVSRIFPLPDILKSFLGVTVLLLLPAAVGDSLSLVVGTLLKREHSRDTGTRFVLNWCLGTVFCVFAAVILTLTGAFSVPALVVTSVAIMVCGAVVRRRARVTRQRSGTKRALFPLVYSSVVALTAVAFLVHRSPFPLWIGYDAFQIEHLAWKAINLNEYNLSVQAMSPLVYRIGEARSLWLVMAVSSLWADCQFTGMVWWAPFFTIPLVCLGTYRFSERLSGSVLVPMIAVAIAAWLQLWGPEPRGVWILRDVTILLVMFPFLLLGTELSDVGSFLRIAATVAVFGAVYHWMETAFVLLLLGIFFALKRFYRSQLFRRTSALLTLLFIVVFVVESRTEALLLPSSTLFLQQIEEDQPVLYANLPDKIDGLESDLGLVVLYLGLAGMALAAVRSITSRGNGDLALRPALMAEVVLLMAFVPVTFTYRIVQYLFPFFPFLIGWVVALLTTSVRKVTDSLGLRYQRVSVAIAVGVTAVLVQLAVLHPLETLLATNTTGTEHATAFLESELEMAQWIRETTPVDTIIVSDPIQQQILMGPGERDALGGSYTLSERVELLKQAFNALDPVESAELFMRAIPDDDRPILVVISGRTAQFAVSPTARKVWRPIPTIPDELIDRFMSSDCFRLAHAVGSEIYAFYLAAPCHSRGQGVP